MKFCWWMKNNASNRTSKINRLLASFLRPVVSILTSTRKWRWLEEKARTEIEEAAWKNFVLGRIKRFDFRRDKFRQECYSRGRKIMFEGDICYLQTYPWYQRTDSYIVQEVFLWYCNCQCPHQKYNSPYLIHTYKGCYEREGGEDGGDISGRGWGHRRKFWLISLLSPLINNKTQQMSSTATELIINHFVS